MVCELEADDDVSVNPLVGGHLYRIAQEGVNNGVRHGKAEHVWIRLHESVDEIVLEIVDDRKGIEEGAVRSSEGIGLRTMH